MAFLIPPSLHNYQLNLSAGYDLENPVSVPQLSPYASYRTLGAFISPSGGMEKSVEVLRTSVSTGPAWYWKKISCRHTVAAKNTY